MGRMLRVVRVSGERSPLGPAAEDELFPLAQAAIDGNVMALRTLLTAVGLLAVLAPALKATRLSVLDALRAE